MTLIDDVQTVCRRLAPHGWADLLAEHGLDITASDLIEELARELPGIRRDLPGFEDFAMEGRRGIEPGNPARSLMTGSPTPSGTRTTWRRAEGRSRHCGSSPSG